MRIFSVNGYTHNQQKSFKGVTKYLNSTGYYGGSPVVEDYKSTTSSIYPQSDYSSLVKNRPFATVEKTLNTYHAGQTREVYYADPEEVVTTAIKENADYVVYDNKPPYPKAEGEVSENYFGTLRHDFVKDFDEVRTYHYRLEMADAKTADKYRRNILANVDVDSSKEKFDYYNARIERSKENQRLAQTCIDLYNKAGDLRYKKETAENEIAQINSQIRDIEYNVEKEKNNVKVKSETLNTKERESLLADLNLKDYKKTEIRNQKLDRINYDRNKAPIRDLNLRNLITEFETLTEELDNTKKTLRESISRSKRYIAQAPSKIKKLLAEKATKEAFIEDIKAKLIPLFDELKTHYNVNNLLHR